MRALSAWVFVVSAGLCTIAQGVSAQDARELFARGQEQYALGHYESAIDAWEAAYALDPRPALQYNLAQAYGRLGRVEDEQRALTAYVEGALAAGASPDDDQMVSARARLVAIRDRIRRTGVQLTGMPDGAEVTVDGQSVEVTNGESVPLAPGSHRIVVAAEGYEDYSYSVVVRAGETMVVPVMLERERDRGAGEESSSGSPLRTVGIVGLSVGGAAIVTGGLLGIVALKKSDGVYDGTSDADSARSMALGSDVALGVGGAIAATGLVLVLVGRPDDDEPAALVVPRVSRDSAEIVVFGRF